MLPGEGALNGMPHLMASRFGQVGSVGGRIAKWVENSKGNPQKYSKVINSFYLASEEFNMRMTFDGFFISDLYKVYYRITPQISQRRAGSSIFMHRNLILKGLKPQSYQPFHDETSGWNPPKKNTYMGVSKNRGTPKSSISIGFSIINHHNHPFWDTPIFGNTHI